MTDKQIIIDGCDVSGCDCYCDGKCLCEYNEINRKIIRYYSCNKFPNCYYKQLKAKEQECESWKALINEAQIEQRKLEQQLEAYKMEAEEGKEINAELKAENEELKIYIESNEQQIKEVETLVMDNDRLINELNQLKQVLSDIKNIVETCNSGVDCSECPYTKECRTDIEAEALGICNLILQKFEGLNE